MFGGAVRLDVDVPAPSGQHDEAASAAELAGRAVQAATDAANPGPVHLNLQYREPLSSGGAAMSACRGDVRSSHPRARSRGRRMPHPMPCPIPHGPLTVVIAGHGAGEQAEATARAGGWPLLAEVSSGARFGPHLVVSYRELLADDGVRRPHRARVVFGHPTLSREVPALLRRADVETIVVNPADCRGLRPRARCRLRRRRERRGARADHRGAPLDRPLGGRQPCPARRRDRRPTPTRSCRSDRAWTPAASSSRWSSPP